MEQLAVHLVGRLPQRTLAQVRFYTGVPARGVNEFWHGFWTSKCRHLRNQGIHVYTGRVNSAGQEKGVDVSLALDLIQATHERRYEAAIIVSQDADFGPAVRLAKRTAQSQNRYLLFESAFPVGPGTSKRGVPGTKWIHIDQATYDACRDPRDYRRPMTRASSVGLRRCRRLPTHRRIRRHADVPAPRTSQHDGTGSSHSY